MQWKHAKVLAVLNWGTASLKYLCFGGVKAPGIPSRFAVHEGNPCPGDSADSSHMTLRWMVRRDTESIVETRKILCPLRESNPDFLIIEPMS